MSFASNPSISSSGSYEDINGYYLMESSSDESVRDNQTVFEDLKDNYSFYFQNGNIKEIVNKNFLVTLKSNPNSLTINGIKDSYVVCAFGKNSDGVNVLSLEEMPGEGPIENWKKVLDRLKKTRCDAIPIEFYILGGILSDESLEIQNQVLELTNEYNIQGVRFNLVEKSLWDDGEEEQSLLVLFSANQRGHEIYYAIENVPSISGDSSDMNSRMLSPYQV